MSDMFLDLAGGIIALSVGLSRLYILRRQYPQLQHILLTSVIRTGAARTRTSLLTFYVSLARGAAVNLALTSAYAAGNISGWAGTLYCLATLDVSSIVRVRTTRGGIYS